MNSTMPIADEATAERAVELFLAGHDPLLYAADLHLPPETVLDQIRWTLRQCQDRLSRRGRAGRKPIGKRPQTSTERSRKSRKRRAEFGS